MTTGTPSAVNPYVSVDCVILGFDGERTNVLVVRQASQGGEGSTGSFKLPGSLINMDENLDEAASRVLFQLTGLSAVNMLQFRAFGGPGRLANPADAVWLKRFHNLQHDLERIVTIAYVALVRIDKKLDGLAPGYEARWLPVEELPKLAFDHNEIATAAVEYVSNQATLQPTMLFDLLPHKFTAAQLRTVMENVLRRKFDLKNFHKRIAQMQYIVPLDEHEVGVAHRAARFFRFDRRRI